MSVPVTQNDVGPTTAKTLSACVWPLALGGFLLLVAWAGPLPQRAAGSFAAHMVMHMMVVALAAPLLAIALTRWFPDQIAELPPVVALLASLIEFIAIWTWHAPVLHDAARLGGTLFLLEQGSFLLAGLLVWTSAIGSVSRAKSNEPRAARAAGVGALLVTSMHMTLLGALLLLAPRTLYACASLCQPAAQLDALGDQQLGGLIMLAVGGAAYLAGGLVLLSSVLRDPAPSYQPSPDAAR